MKTDSCICSPMHPKCLNSAWHRVGSQQMNVEFNLILTVPRPHHFTEEEVMLPLLSLNCPEAPRIHTRLTEVALSSLLFCTTPKAVWSISYARHFHSPLFALLIVEACFRATWWWGVWGTRLSTMDISLWKRLYSYKQGTCPFGLQVEAPLQFPLKKITSCFVLTLLFLLVSYTLPYTESLEGISWFIPQLTNNFTAYK